MNQVIFSYSSPVNYYHFIGEWNENSINYTISFSLDGDKRSLNGEFSGSKYKEFVTKLESIEPSGWDCDNSTPNNRNVGRFDISYINDIERQPIFHYWFETDYPKKYIDFIEALSLCDMNVKSLPHK